MVMMIMVVFGGDGDEMNWLFRVTPSPTAASPAAYFNAATVAIFTVIGY